MTTSIGRRTLLRGLAPLACASIWREAEAAPAPDFSQIGQIIDDELARRGFDGVPWEIAYRDAVGRWILIDSQGRST